MASADFVTGESSSAVFSGDRVTTGLPRHEVIKLIVDGYGLTGFLDGTVVPPSRFMPLPDGLRAPNLAAQVFLQQDRLLTSWLLSTVSTSLQSSFDDASTACDMWNMAINLFATDTGAKQSRIRHELHSLKKGNLSIKAYVKIEVMLAGLPSEFEAVISSARLSTGVLSLQRVVDALVDCESRQAQVLQEVSLNANLVEDAPSVEGGNRGGRTSVRGRGRTFRSRIQCQICSRFGHVAQKCYYRYHRESNNQGDPSGVERAAFGPCAQEEDEQYVAPYPKSQRTIYGQGNYASQNRNGGQNWSASMQSEKLARRPQVSYPNEYGRPYGNHFKPNLRQFGHDNGPGFNGDGNNGNASLNFIAGNGRCGLQGPNVVNSTHGPNIDPNTNGVPSSNFVQVDQSDPGSPEPFGVDRVLRFTKPCARVCTGFEPCIGLPRLGDLHASDYSDPSESGSHVNTAQLGFGTSKDDPYVPVQGGTTTWYPDSGASHHVCRDVSALRDVTPYSGYDDSGDIADGPHS
ncbi:hypothetical protein V6Z11_D12G171100 [Gossypium hirsutum]